MDVSEALILARDCVWPCLTCGMNPTTCLSCYVGDYSYLQEDKCLEQCPNGYFDAGLYTCEECDP